ncbi:hypothetical protein [Absidia glauca]|uniref:SH3 domain-containing protein n=1 Tax=Absidia glauca TaxID=4829 RepID=A0A168MGV7_ABSGL|nr:hypothetical protein [Absidia glauca]
MHTSSSLTSTSTILMAVAAVIPVSQARYLWHPNELAQAKPVVRDSFQPLQGMKKTATRICLLDRPTEQLYSFFFNVIIGDYHLVNRGFQNADPTTKAEESSSKKDPAPTTKADPKPTASDKPTSKAASKAPETKSAAPHTTDAASKESSKPNASSSAGKSTNKSSSPTDAPSASGLLPTDSSASSASSSSAVISPSSSSAADSAGGGVSSGAVAGIVIAVLAVVGAIAAFVMVRRKKQARRSPNPDPFTMGFGSHDPSPPSAYNNGASANAMSQPYHYQEQQQPQPVHMPPISPTYSTPPPPLSPLSDVPPYQQQQYYAATAPVSEKTAVAAAPVVAGLGAAAIASNDHDQQQQQQQQQTQQAGQPTPQQDVPQGSLGVFNVVSTYSPTLSDEIDIQLGDRIEILVEYDDGWCQGVNLTRGNAKGVFPRHCVEQHPGAPEIKNDGPPQLELGSLKRVSSMYMAYN